MSIDLTVMGAGVFGLCAAFAAARQGAGVQVIDPAGPGAGASGGLVGALAPHAPENWTEDKAIQLEALLMATGWWGRVADVSRRPTGFARLGRVQVLADARAVDQARLREDAALVHWQGAASWRVRAATGPFDPVTPTGLVVEDTLSARLHPRLALGALVAGIEALGGRVTRGGKVQGAVLWATGAAGLRDLGQALGRDIGRGEKGQALAVNADLGLAPQIYAPGLHIVPHVDGTVAIGSTSERDYTSGTTTDAQLDALHARACEVLPALRGATVLARWAGERPRAVSRRLVLGPWPGRPGHFVANGGFKTGFALAPWAAEQMVALVLQGVDRLPDVLRLQPS